MFIIDPTPNREAKIILRGVKKSLGLVPPHFELFATINLKRFQMFLEEITYLAAHENINPDFFGLLRYKIASQNHFLYCVEFNKSLLLSKGYTQEQLSHLTSDENVLPLDDRHQKLFDSVLVAIDRPNEFTIEKLDSLKSIEWSDADIYDAIDHGAFLFKFSKILKAYSKN